MSKLFKKILLLVGSGFILMFLILVSVLWAFSNNLPDYKYLKSYKAPVSSKIYSGDGELIQDFSSEKKEFLFLTIQYLKKLLILFYLQRIKTFLIIQE